jgi:hypothetical protein
MGTSTQLTLVAACTRCAQRPGLGYEYLTRVVEYRRRIDPARLRVQRHDHGLLQGLIQHRRDPGSVWLSVLAHGHIRHRLHWTHALAQAPPEEPALPGW